MKHMVQLTVTLIIAVLALASLATADVPHMINYQGRLTDALGNPVPDGNYQITFTIYDAATDGNVKWTSGSQTVGVANGLFTYQLGWVAPFLPLDLFADTLRWLGIKVGTDPELVPRTRLVTAPYAYRVATVDSAFGGAIVGALRVMGDTLPKSDESSRTPGQWGSCTGFEAQPCIHVYPSATLTDWATIDLDGAAGKATIGPNHTNTGQNSFVAGAWNQATGDYSTIGGGIYSSVDGYGATVGGGVDNDVLADFGTIGGGDSNFVNATGVYGTIGGGNYNEVHDNYGTIGGGHENIASGFESTIGGGRTNISSSSATTVAGGAQNEASGLFSTVGGGGGNTASVGPGSTVAGGQSNVASNNDATVGGGSGNIASGLGATVPGGQLNTASGINSLAAGVQAVADDNNSFVWNDGSAGIFNSEAPNQFWLHATGGARIVGDDIISAVAHLRVDGSISIFNSLPGPNGNTSLFFGQENVASPTTTLGEWGIQYWPTSLGGGGLNFWKPTGSSDGGFGNNILFLDDNHNVGINTATPSAQLHVVRQMSVSGEEAVQVDFGNTVGPIVTTGITVAGTPSATDGGQNGVIATVSMTSPSWQIGSAEARLAVDQSFDFLGNFRGVLGSSTPVTLSNSLPSKTSMGLGGHFMTGTATNTNTLNGTGTYWVGGVLGEVNGSVNGNPGLGAVAGVIGVDNNTGTAPSWAGYFQGRGYFSDKVGIGTTALTHVLSVAGDACNSTGVWAVCSDRRLKTDIKPIQGALETVEKLRGVSFRWKDSKKDAEYGRVRGFIAQDVETVIPEWVNTDRDGYKSLEPIGIEALVVEAVKEQQKAINDLRGQLADLQAQKTAEIESLKAQMAQMQALVETILAQHSEGSNKLAITK
jgi:hypothetical protein